MAKAPTKSEWIEIQPLKRGRLTVQLIGTTPLYFNSMSLKARASLLIGSAKKTAAEKLLIKHNPELEFRASIYRMADGPTLLGFPAPGLKGAMSSAALETPGAKKTQVQRLVFLPSVKVCVWGRPYLKMDVVRSADMAKTPDIRTRAYLPEWCAEVDVAFVSPPLNATSIVTLLANGGLICGIGDYRQEKGKGSFGSYEVVSDAEQEAAYKKIVKYQGRSVQEAAMAAPEAADEDTQELWNLLIEERNKREANPELYQPKPRKPRKPKTPPKVNGGAADVELNADT